jgi:uncharacterized protein
MQPATVAVSVKPGAKAAAITFNHGMVEIRVKEPAREGRANTACAKLLAKTLGVPPSTVRLVRGAQSRVKIFALTTLGPADLTARLARVRP